MSSHKRSKLRIILIAIVILVALYIIASIIFILVTDRILIHSDQYFYNLAATARADYQAQTKALDMPSDIALQKTCFHGIEGGPSFGESKIYKCAIQTQNEIRRPYTPTDTMLVQQKLVPLLKQEGYTINKPDQIDDTMQRIALLWATTVDKFKDNVCSVQVDSISDYNTHAQEMLAYSLSCSAQTHDTPKGFTFDTSLHGSL